MGAIKQLMLEQMDRREKILSRKPPGRGNRRCKTCGEIYSIIKGRHQDGFPIIEHHPYDQCWSCTMGD